MFSKRHCWIDESWPVLSRWLTRWLACVLFALVCVGCGAPKPPPVPTFKTTGTITYKNGDAIGQGAIVQFISGKDRSLNMSAHTGDDGSFELVTLHGNDNLAGAIEGPCHVIVTLPITSPIPTVIQLKEPYEITQGDNHFDIQLGVNAQ